MTDMQEGATGRDHRGFPFSDLTDRKLRAKVTSTRFTDAAETRTLVQCIGEKIMSWSQEAKVQN